MPMTHANPTLTVFCGPMFSSKTSKLLLELERYKHQHKRVIAFKPALDARYGADKIVTHMGLSYSATVVRTGNDILGVLAELDNPPDVVAVDEAFMLSGVADVLIWLYRTGVTIVVASLEMSATGKSFPEIEKLLPWATRVDKCAGVCTECGRDAHYTHKKQASDDEIEVGGGELYEPRCFAHHVHIDNRVQV